MMKKLLFFAVWTSILCCACTFHASKDIKTYHYNTKELNAFLRTGAKCPKAVYIFDLSCGQCTAYLKKFYPAMRERYGDSLTFCFIAIDDTLGRRYASRYLADLGIAKGFLLLYTPDMGSMVRQDGRMDLNGIFRGMAPKTKPIDFIGYPTSALIGKDKYLKLQKIKYIDSDSIFLRPCPWHDIFSYDLPIKDVPILPDTVVDLGMKRTIQNE